MHCSKSTRRNRGSASLEAALTLPLVLLLLTALAQSIQTQLAENQLRGALNELAGEISLVLIGLDYLPELQDSSGEPEHSVPDSLPQELLREFAVSGLTAPLIGERLSVLTAEEREANPQAWRALSNFSIYFERGDQQSWHALHLFYRRKILFHSKDCQLTAVVSDWSNRGSDGATADSTEQSEGDELWMLDNFSRGKAFRDRFGANLPEFYPTIACFDQGKATMIKSWDLTAPSYRAPGYLEKQFLEAGNKLTAFKGSTEYDIGPQSAGDILHRELLVIVPENSPMHVLQELQHIQHSLPGIAVRIELSGTSGKHEIP